MVALVNTITAHADFSWHCRVVCDDNRLLQMILKTLDDQSLTIDQVVVTVTSTSLHLYLFHVFTEIWVAHML